MLAEAHAPPVRIVVVDDHPITRQGLIAAFGGSRDAQVIGEAGSGEDAIALVAELLPDVVFMDLRMPGMGGIDAIRVIHARHPDVRVIAFTVDESRASLALALKAGASGYFLKDVGGEELIGAARRALAGEVVIHPALADVYQDIATMLLPVESVRLTGREVEILRRYAVGASTPEVADQLGMPTDAIRGYVERLQEKLRVADLPQAVAVAIRRGLIG
jgi:DNA-binding NarL/FixJ family response regulator